MRRNELSRATIVYIVLLVLGIGIFALEPSWTGLGAVLLVLPGIAISRVLDSPARRKAVRA
jgi:hypothetical protein